MKIVKLLQGSQEWDKHRREHYNASDAPAMMGESPYKSRDQLIREIATGITPDVDPATRARFDEGHLFEALARPIAEQLIGEDLYPVVGVNGKYSASFDGLNMDCLELIPFEHKRINESIRAADCDNAETLPLHYRIQMEHQLMVSCAKKALFLATNWNDREELTESFETWYEQDLDLRAKIIAGWEQLAIDVENYRHVEPEVKAVGRAPDSLPALRVEVTGMVTSSNLKEFKETALAVFGSINKDLKTDEDFANAEKTVKWCAAVEERLDATKASALSQTASIEELFIAIDSVKAEARAARLELQNLIKINKESVRLAILTEAQKAIADHINTINDGLEMVCLPRISEYIADKMKGKKTITSLRGAANDEVARVKIEASSLADLIRVNAKIMRANAKDHMFLFGNLGDIMLKSSEDLTNFVSAKISAHETEQAEKKAAELARMKEEACRKANEQLAADTQRIKDEAAAAEREKIRKEAEIAAEAKKADQHAAFVQMDEVLVAEGDSPVAVKKTPASKEEAVVTNQKTRTATKHDVITLVSSHFNMPAVDAEVWLNTLFG